MSTTTSPRGRRRYSPERVKLDGGSILKIGLVAGAITFGLWLMIYLVLVVIMGLGIAVLGGR